MKPVLCVLVLSAGLYAAAPSAPVPAREVRKTLPIAAGKQVFLEGAIGDVTVRPGEAKQADVVARIEPQGDCAENKDRVAKTEVLIDAIPEGVRVRTVQDNAKQNLGVLEAFIKTCDAPHVNFTITVPRTTKLDLRVDRSSVDVQDMDAGLRVRMRRGRVIGNALAGPADVDIRGGEIRVDFRKVDRPSRFQMLNGMLEVRVPKNAKFDLNYEGHPHRLESAFPIKSRELVPVNGGGPRLNLSMMHGMTKIVATEPAPEPKPAATRKAAKKNGR